MTRNLLALLLSFTLASCAASSLRQYDAGSPGSSTTVLFLVDGLTAKTLKSSLDQNEMPNLSKFFLSKQSAFALGRAVFPSLTYPNISSILTARALGEQPVTANHQVIGKNKVLNFESQSKHDDLNDLIGPISVFGQLEKAGHESASFSYVFGMNATFHMQAALQEGLDYKNHDYRALDARLIENLENFLIDREESGTLPKFIFVHLVGVDGTAHLFGPNSKQLKKYLHWLDKRLKKTLKLLARAEKRNSVATILSSDHGFVQTDFYVDAEEIVEKVDRKILVTNESRFLGLYTKNQKSLSRVLGALLGNPGVEMVALRQGNSLLLKTAAQEIRFEYGPAICPGFDYSLAITSGNPERVSHRFQCPNQLNQLIGPYPFLVEDFSRYLNTKNHPDALALAKTNVAFTEEAKGSHGGPTGDEMLVPVLLRNFKIEGSSFIRTSDLLKFFFQETHI